jgi:hypothetical protein
MSALLVCAVVAVTWSSTGIGAAPPIQRSYAGGSFMLELDGVQVGFVSGVEGGLPFSDVVKLAGEDFFFKKHLANPSYRDIRLELGAGLDKSVYSWIGMSLQGQPVRKDGALLSVDFKGTVRSRLEFTRAQITEVTFPAADASSKDPVRILIGLTPEQTSLNRKAVGTASPKAALTKKTALSANFKLSIDGLNVTKVSKIEAVTVKIPLMGECVRCEENPPETPARVDVSNVIIILTEADAESVYDWFEDFLISGNSDDSNEKGGTLQFLAPDRQSPLFTINFHNLGIFELMLVPSDALGDTMPRIIAAMYCESVEFSAQ